MLDECASNVCFHAILLLLLLCCCVRCLCTGEKGLGKSSKKPLHLKVGDAVHQQQSKTSMNADIQPASAAARAGRPNTNVSISTQV
jgi:hypothetical protein